jgi:hypothetical protein
MERLYLDTNGDTQPRNAFDYHHIIARSSARSKGQRSFVNQEGLVVPLFRVWHNIGKTAIHANVPLARVPDIRLARVITHTLLENRGDNVYDRFIDVADVVKNLAEYSDDTALSRDARRLSRNFDLQMPYILSGQVRTVDEIAPALQERFVV